MRPWCMLLDDMILISQKRKKINDKLELQRNVFESYSFKINRKWHILWSASANSCKSRKEDLVCVEKEYCHSVLGEQPLSRETIKQNGGLDEDIIDIITN